MWEAQYRAATLSEQVLASDYQFNKFMVDVQQMLDEILEQDITYLPWGPSKHRNGYLWMKVFDGFYDELPGLHFRNRVFDDNLFENQLTIIWHPGAPTKYSDIFDDDIPDDLLTEYAPSFGDIFVFDREDQESIQNLKVNLKYFVKALFNINRKINPTKIHDGKQFMEKVLKDKQKVMLKNVFKKYRCVEKIASPEARKNI